MTAQEDNDSKPFCWDGAHEIEGGVFTNCIICHKSICDDHDLRTSSDEAPLCLRHRRLLARDLETITTFRPGKPRPCNRGCGKLVFLSNRGDGKWRPYESWADGTVSKDTWLLHECKTQKERTDISDLFSPEALEMIATLVDDAARITREAEGEEDDEFSWDDVLSEVDPISSHADRVEKENAQLKSRIDILEQELEALRKRLR